MFFLFKFHSPVNFLGIRIECTIVATDSQTIVAYQNQSIAALRSGSISIEGTEVGSSMLFLNIKE